MSSKIVECGSCGASNIEGAKFCNNCGGQFLPSSEDIVVSAGYRLVQEEPPPQTMAPKRKVNNLALSAIVIIVVAVIIASTALVALSPDNGRSFTEPKSGDYILYSLSGTSGGVSVSGSARMQYTSVSSSSYSVTTTFNMNSYTNSTTTTYAKSGNEFVQVDVPLTDSSSTASPPIFISNEKISTAYGIQDVKHYRSTDPNGNTTDSYLSVYSGMPLKMVLGFGTKGIITMSLTEATADWQGTVPPTNNNGIIVAIVTLMAAAIAIVILFAAKRDPVQMPYRTPLQPPQPAAPPTRYPESAAPIRACARCLEPLEENSVYCKKCGNKVK